MRERKVLIVLGLLMLGLSAGFVATTSVAEPVAEVESTGLESTARLETAISDLSAGR